MELTPGLFLALCLGGGLGSMARASLAGWMARHGAAVLAIFVVNLSGSFLIGLAFGLHGDAAAAPRIPEAAFAVFAMGFLGGYTTVSTHALQVLDRWQEGRRRAAVTLAFGAVLSCPLAAVLGAQTASLGGW